MLSRLIRHPPGNATRLAILTMMCGSFLPVLNSVVIPGLRAGICCAVLRGSLYVCMRYSVRLSSWINKGDYYYFCPRYFIPKGLGNYQNVVSVVVVVIVVVE